MKRAFDIAFSFLGLIVLAPLLSGLCLLQYFKMGRPLFFRQERAGLGGKFFQIIKFRSMIAGSEGDITRTTTWGKFLRSTSLDELPELFNVLRGDMSLVGPRPLPTEYLPLYNTEQARRHAVRPGITGWAQINGRNNITWKRQFELDLWYIDHSSLLLDFKILVLTFYAVLSRKGINASETNTRTAFKGEIFHEEVE
ncbi:MAG: putative sugar transferase EpsL [Opitutia bacterium UBA7350]|nr:MAG: putative sugar transferase EpsL [Opitutae bacterium UBA7350]